MGRSLLILVFAAVVAPAAWAHSLPKSQYDRTVTVRLDPAGVEVTYQVVLSEDTMQFDGLKILRDEGLKQIPATRDSFIRWYAEAKGGRIAKSLFATLNDRDVTFRLHKWDVSQVDHNKRFEFQFRAEWWPTSGVIHQFRFADDTQFVGKDGLTPTDDVDGVVSLGFAKRELHTVADLSVTEPTGLQGKPRADLKPGEEALRRQCSATFTVVGPPPVIEAPAVQPPTGTVQADDRSLPEQMHDRGLLALVDSNLGIGLLLVLSALFGMAHAFTPGHGKTMVAAYLVGERGTVWHAVTLGLTATVAHTGSVILVAVGLYAFYGNTAPASAQGWLMMAGGLLIFLVGLWLFMQRLRGRADHVHLFGDHDHHHGDGHHHHHVPAVQPKTNFGWLRVILLGLGGGIIPCWDAVMMLLVAMAQGQIGLAIPLLLAFSVGLATVMIGLGLAVLYAARVGGAKFGESRWFRFLPVASALVLLVMGVWFLRDGFQMLGTKP